jgi:hypothetical protein
MPRFASETTVTPERTRAEIEATLCRYHASQFFYGWHGTTAMIGFTIKGHTIQLAVPLPDRSEKKFTHRLVRGYWKPLTEQQREAAYEQAKRQRWRALLLLVKANLEAVDLGLLSVEEAFLGSILLRSGQTVAQAVLPQLGAAAGDIKLLPGS